MNEFSARHTLVLSLQRALLGQVHPQLRQASIEADDKLKLVRLRFEYDGDPSEAVWDSCSCAAAEVISDFPEPWTMEDQHVPVPAPLPLSPLSYVVYSRAESWHTA